MALSESLRPRAGLHQVIQFLRNPADVVLAADKHLLYAIRSQVETVEVLRDVFGYQEIEGYRLVVFNLVECEMLVRGTIEKDDGTVKKTMEVIRPRDCFRALRCLCGDALEINHQK